MPFYNFFKNSIINLESYVSFENDTHLFALDISNHDTSEVKSVLFKLLSNDRISQINCKKDLLSQKQMILCDALLIFTISSHFNIHYNQIYFETNNFNSLKINDSQKIYFNKSHSKNMICCAFSDRAVGVDIQEHRKAKYNKIADRYFTLCEKQMLKNKNYDKKSFFDIWSKKEAYSKMLGKGLNKNLSTLDYSNCKFNFVDIFESYSLCLCEYADE